MRELTFGQKAAGCGLGLLIALVLAAVTAVAINAMTGKVADASVRIHESADTRLIVADALLTAREGIKVAGKAVDRTADVAGKSLDVAQTGQGQDSAADFWRFCTIAVLAICVLGALVVMRRRYV